MLSDMSAYGKAQARMMDPDRRKKAESRNGTNVLKGRSIDDIREEWGLYSATDDEIRAMLKGQQSDE